MAKSASCTLTSASSPVDVNMQKPYSIIEKLADLHSEKHHTEEAVRLYILALDKIFNNHNSFTDQKLIFDVEQLFIKLSRQYLLLKSPDHAMYCLYLNYKQSKGIEINKNSLIILTKEQPIPRDICHLTDDLMKNITPSSSSDETYYSYKLETIHETLSNILFNRKDYNISRNHAKLCLEMKIKRLGSWHIEVSKILLIIADTYLEEKKASVALTHYKLALKTSLKAGSPIKDYKIYRKIGSIYKDHNKGQEALTYYNKAIKYIKDGKNKSNHTYKDIKALYNDISEAYFGMGNIENAAKYLDKALRIERNEIGVSKSRDMENYAKLAGYYEMLSQIDKCRKALVRLYAIQVVNFGGAHLCTQVTMLKIEAINKRII